ncbi:hypothetical protein AMAG_09673 [Allomyces macrogynus ATCC 38327]|uniref:Atos-like conserved domain-containing protein n=1 Tax=Allomyces macrogynus (strain ATCC 38327) TaxID=578462 RepID=A0A0L0STP5_ALLM3|nr:hypothetical protein AMAG_09673 [Allomyces macrogynus ATCC 38327]|eukprot:KNE65689.1 hypothetical protein AMAG_09673 [Allomyces macrogynus ATCC 38327]
MAGLSELGPAPEGYGLVYRKLSLPGARLTDMAFLGRFQHLEFLELYCNHISDVTPLGQLPYLFSVDLSNNKLTSFSMPSVPVNLQDLDLSRNQLMNVLDLRGHKYMRHLCLDRNLIKSLDGLQECSFLTHLSLVNNGVQSMQGLEGLPIRVLDLRRNRLRSLAETASLPDLEELYASHNELHSLTDLCTSHSRLAVLAVDHNLISLEADILHLQPIPSLRSLSLRGNPLHLAHVRSRTSSPTTPPTAPRGERAYRHRILFHLPHLERLDGLATGVQEKVAARNAFDPPMEVVAAVAHATALAREAVLFEDRLRARHHRVRPSSRSRSRVTSPDAQAAVPNETQYWVENARKQQARGLSAEDVAAGLPMAFDAVIVNDDLDACYRALEKEAMREFWAQYRAQLSEERAMMEMGGAGAGGCLPVAAKTTSSPADDSPQRALTDLGLKASSLESSPSSSPPATPVPIPPRPASTDSGADTDESPARRKGGVSSALGSTILASPPSVSGFAQYDLYRAGRTTATSPPLVTAPQPPRQSPVPVPPAAVAARLALPTLHITRDVPATAVLSSTPVSPARSVPVAARSAPPSPSPKLSSSPLGSPPRRASLLRTAKVLRFPSSENVLTSPDVSPPPSPQPAPMPATSLARKPSTGRSSRDAKFVGGSYAESLLSGRLPVPASLPIMFTATVSAMGSGMAPASVTVEFPAQFYCDGGSAGGGGGRGGVIDPSDSDDLVPGGYRVPRTGQLQVIIKNPERTAVKVFLVPYNCSELSARSKTVMRVTQFAVIRTDPRVRSLRYALQVPLVMTRARRLYVSGAIRVVFAGSAIESYEELVTEVDRPLGVATWIPPGAVKVVPEELAEGVERAAVSGERDGTEA